MSYQEILLLRICLVFLMRELSKGLRTKVMHVVLLVTVRNWNQRKHLEKP